MNAKQKAVETSPVITSSEKVRCQGIGPDSGHPAIYIAFGNNERVVCSYCSQEFVFDKDADKQD